MSSIKTQAGVAINQNIGRGRHFSGKNPLINHYGRSRHPSKHKQKSPFLGITPISQPLWQLMNMCDWAIVSKWTVMGWTI